MSTIGVPFALPWLAFVVCWLVFGWGATALHALAGRALARLAPDQRGAVLLALALAPLACGVAVAVLGFVPLAGGHFVDAHCHAEIGCRPHVPILEAEMTLAVLLVFGIAAWSVIAWRSVATGVREGRGLALALERLARPAAGADAGRAIASSISDKGGFSRTVPAVAVIESDAAFAYCTGVLRPRVVVSRALVDRLTPRQLEIVLAHEHAHAARYDNLRRVVAGIGLRLAPARPRRALLKDLALAAELTCDAEAAHRAGSADAVVETLHALHALPRAVSGDGPVPSGPEAIAVRVAALSGGPFRRLPSWWLAVIAAAAFTAVTLPAVRFAHHAVEALLGWTG